MAAPLVGLDYTYTFFRESAFGTPVAASGIQIPTEEMTIDHAPVTHALQRATGLRGSIEDDAWQDQVGSTPTASCSFYLSEGMMALLPAVLQKSEDYSAASSIWTFTTYNYADLPDFSDDEGYTYTLIANSPAASGDDAYITSAVGSNMTLSIAPDSNDGALYCSMDFIGKSSTLSATVAPTIIAPSMAELYKWSEIGLVKVGARDITDDFISAEWSIANNAKAIPSAPANDFALLRWEVTGSFTMLDDSANAEALKAMCLSTAPASACSFEVFWNSIAQPLDAAGEAVITTNVVLNEFTVDNSEEAKVTFTFTGHFSSDGGTKPFTLRYFETA